MLAARSCGAALAVLAGSWGCAVPHGSFARPVKAPASGAHLVGGGAIVPVFVSERAETADALSSYDKLPARGVVVPAASYDYTFSPRHSLGLEVALVRSNESTFVITHPRWEYGLRDWLSLTADVYFALGSGRQVLRHGNLSAGLRAYLPTGFGGFAVSQQLGTSFVSIFAPGSVAYDVPLRFGDTVVLHIFPELRWDPTLTFINVESRALLLISAGASMMLEF